MVKTREIVSLSKNAEVEIHISVCPICHTPLPASLPAAKSSAATHSEKRPAELPPAKISGDQD